VTIRDARPADAERLEALGYERVSRRVLKTLI